MTEGRPPHPLFGGAGAKNMLAEAAKQMEKKRIDNPTEDPRPSKQLAVVGSDSANDSHTTPRPPHPMMGGGKSSLNNEILAMAAKRNARANNAVADVPKEEPVKKYIEDVLPAHSKPLNAPTSTLAEQVAIMAARRHNRLNGGASQEEDTAPPEMKMRPIAPEPLAPPPPKSKPVEPKTASKSSTTAATTNNPTPAEPKKKAWFSKKAEEPEKIAKARDYSAKKDVPSRPPAFQQAQLRKADESPMSPTSPASPPTFAKAKLKPTGIPLTATTKDEETPSEPPVVVREAPPPPMPVQRVVKEAVPAPPSQKTRTVTKSDPTYEVTEYKCVCVIL